MTVIAWIVEGIWPACVDATRTWAPESVGIVLLDVTGQQVSGTAGSANSVPGGGGPACTTGAVITTAWGPLSGARFSMPSL